MRAAPLNDCESEIYVTYCYCFRQANVQKKRAAAKERLKKHREKIYSNPELLEEYRRKERERSEII